MTDFPALPDGRFDIIYADPPWQYRDKIIDRNKGKYAATDHYPTVSIDDLKTLDIKSISADNCILFMWSSSPHLDVAIELGIAWGFSYKTVAFCWNKCMETVGHYTRSQVELCLVFKRGTIPQPRGSRNESQLLTVKRTEHSVKPDEIRHRIDRMFPTQRKIELFARRKAPGWTIWGNEAPDDDITPTLPSMLTEEQ